MSKIEGIVKFVKEKPALSLVILGAVCAVFGLEELGAFFAVTGFVVVGGYKALAKPRLSPSFGGQ